MGVVVGRQRDDHREAAKLEKALDLLERGAVAPGLEPRNCRLRGACAFREFALGQAGPAPRLPYELAADHGLSIAFLLSPCIATLLFILVPRLLGSDLSRCSLPC